jgi:pSer/pThr/pTyr-binding forkhead associated (FHA) protein
MALASVNHPGLLLVFSGTSPRFEPLGLLGPSMRLGRGSSKELGLDDPALSREHARVTRRGDAWLIEDLDSRNGTYVDGVKLAGSLRGAPRVVRVGGTIFALRNDIVPCTLRPLRVEDDIVMGPATRAVLDAVAGIARSSAMLHVTGESGVGKELAAHAFHASGPRAGGPFVAVNCATIPRELAERLLFGTRRGAYSGADKDAEGYVQAAHRGTLFLDEVGELHPSVQAKLLRVLESREVMPLGATRSQPVDVRICSATTRSLRDLVAAGHFREDLYFRLARPAIEVPPLRERLEEIPWLVQRALAEQDARLKPHAALVEACLLRHWPGNVRELLTEVRTAGLAALTKGVDSVTASHLSPAAGLALAATPDASQKPARKRRAAPSRGAIEAGLRQHGGTWPRRPVLWGCIAPSCAAGSRRPRSTRLSSRWASRTARGDPEASAITWVCRSTPCRTRRQRLTSR